VILNQEYDGLKSMLQTDQPYFKSIDATAIYFHPYFDNNRFRLPGISSLTDGADRINLLDDLLNHWKSDQDRFKIIELGDKKKWVDFLGFEPINTIVGSELILASEKAPEFLLQWLNEGEYDVNTTGRYEFLRSLGVSLAGSDIVRIRKYLTGEEMTIPGINYNIPEVLIRNTLVFISERQVSYPINGTQSELIKELYTRLPDDSDFSSIPLPIFSGQHYYCFELDYTKDGQCIDANTLSQLVELNYPTTVLSKAIGASAIYTGLFRSLKCLNKFAVVTIQFDLVDIEAVELNGIELNREFYAEWRQMFPNYRIVQYPGQMPHVLKYIQNTIFKYNKKDIDIINHSIVVSMDKNDKSMIALIETGNYLPANAMQQLKELFNRHDDSIQDFLNRIQSNQKLREEFEKLKDKEKIEQKKKNYQRVLALMLRIR